MVRTDPLALVLELSEDSTYNQWTFGWMEDRNDATAQSFTTAAQSANASANAMLTKSQRETPESVFVTRRVLLFGFTNSRSYDVAAVACSCTFQVVSTNWLLNEQDTFFHDWVYFCNFVEQLAFHLGPHKDIYKFVFPETFSRHFEN